MNFNLLTQEALSIFLDIAKCGQEHELKDLFADYAYE
jgi:hypothetical protein